MIDAESSAERFRRVSEHFSAVAAACAPSAWDNDAVCEGWKARDVVRHLVEWVPAVFREAGIDFGDPIAVDVDPTGAWESLRSVLQRALDDPAVAARSFDAGPPGTMTVEQAIAMLVTGDVLIHTWDLATAVGVEPTLDTATAAQMLKAMEPLDEILRSSGHYGPRVAVDDGADDVTRLIAFTGRDPELRTAPGAGDIGAARTRFDDADLSGARFELVDLSASRFHNVDLSRAKFTGVELVDVEISGYVERVAVNGVDIGPLVEAELDRRYPLRSKMRPTDAAGFRDAWDAVEGMWPETIERARALPSDALHMRVDGEWSFIETLRHLVFATDAWIRRAVMGMEDPYHPLGLGHVDLDASVPSDRAARPSLDEMLAVRADRMQTMRSLLETLTDDELAGQTNPIPAPGYPPAGQYPMARCLGSVVNEEWEHRLIAERDLATLTARFDR